MFVNNDYLTTQPVSLLGTQFVEEIDANGLVKKAGEELVAAFHNKADPEGLERLVKAGAPVYYRLDYGLEVKLEADFVFAFWRILGGEEGPESLQEGCNTVFGSHGQEVYNYTRTSSEFYRILYDTSANQEFIPLSPAFVENLKQNPYKIRANPDHTNGSLIIAAGLRDPELVKEIMALGKQVEEKDNGAHVDFRGYFDVHAAVWSAILLDEDTLCTLLDGGSALSLSVCGSNLLHWACAAAGLDASEERMHRARNTIQRLVTVGTSLIERNKLGKQPWEYAPEHLWDLVKPNP